MSKAAMDHFTKTLALGERINLLSILNNLKQLVCIRTCDRIRARASVQKQKRNCSFLFPELGPKGVRVNTIK